MHLPFDASESPYFEKFFQNTTSLEPVRIALSSVQSQRSITSGLQMCWR